MKKQKYLIVSYRENGDIKHSYRGKRNYNANRFEPIFQEISPTYDILIRQISNTHKDIMKKDRNIIKLETKVLEIL